MEQNPMSEQQGFHGTFSQLRQTVEGMLEEKQKTVEGMGELLAVKTKLLPYSMYTALAIHLQNPQAQYAAPYHEWRKMGYQIQELSSIKLWVPIQETMFERGGKLVPISQAQPEEKLAIFDETLQVQVKTSYRMSQVYDIAQTNCPKRDYERVMGNPYLHLDYGEKYDCMQAAAEKSGIRCREKSKPGFWAYYAGGEIVVSSRIHPAQKLAGFCAAYARGLVRQTSSQDPRTQEFEERTLTRFLQTRLGVPENLMWAQSTPEADQLPWMVSYSPDAPTPFLDSLTRVQRMLRFVDQQASESVKELGLDLVQEQKEDQALIHRLDENFMADID